MNDVSLMKILNAFDELMDNVTIVKIFEYFLSNGVVEIGFHELKNKVQIFIIFGLDDSMQFDNILVINLMQEDNFAIGALGVCGVLEGIEYFFECEEFAGFDLVDFPDVTVGATADFFEEFVAG